MSFERGARVSEQIETTGKRVLEMKSRVQEKRWLGEFVGPASYTADGQSSVLPKFNAVLGIYYH